MSIKITACMCTNKIRALAATTKLKEAKPLHDCGFKKFTERAIFTVRLST